MAAVSALMVKELRERTSLGMMECKKALTQSEGDMDEAEKILRVRLGKKASKAATRVAAEGIVAIHISEDKKMVLRLFGEKLMNRKKMSVKRFFKKLGMVPPKPEKLEVGSKYQKISDEATLVLIERFTNENPNFLSYWEEHRGNNSVEDFIAKFPEYKAR